MNKETLKNAFQRFTEEGILVIRKSSDRTPPVCRISDEWMPRRDEVTGEVVEQGRLWAFMEAIAVSRREGKNRRDNASVSMRVLGLAGRCGAELFKDAERARL